MDPYGEELARVLPPDIPHRDELIHKCARHLQMMEAANELMNLTRIATPLEAAVKHIYDSVAPWTYFQAAERVLDAGTGAGFPGVPLAIVLPQTRFILSESIQKKARFVDSVVDALELPNVQVRSERAEEIVSSAQINIITARAVAPIVRILDLFGKQLKAGSKLLLYKGPDVETELADALGHPVKAQVVFRYELPGDLGTRSLVEVRAATRAERVKSQNHPTQNESKATQRSNRS